VEEVDAEGDEHEQGNLPRAEEDLPHRDKQ